MGAGDTVLRGRHRQGHPRGGRRGSGPARLPAAGEPTLSAPSTISLHEVTVTVDTPGGDLVLLRPTTVELGEHRIALIGGNGSGKSTFARLLNGLVEPTTGTVTVNGLDTAKDGPAVRRQVGFVFTNPDAQLVMPTCLEDIALSLRRSVPRKSERHAQARAILDELGLGDKADTSVHALSGGQKQMLALAGVLATGPRVLVADEPTTLLDLRNTRLVAERLFSLPQQLVLVTHDLELAARCDRALVVDDAAIVFDGAPAEAVAFYRDRVGR
ncbi:energy-coupling factor ABC transporter ATP-binding protein [Aeromicrobium wangtongii]|uniref:Energy-coupling factor ABC transporter ATP-binding protein n=1 Tax=Aeromicrobium wangtongii TaxID=2969247 RepID=A0ABY5MBG4_9ACTN|nr:energy-coupling factor ABC transporter ATP-binding protein [Aeromicrobium wangtongii]MCD9199631.1 energy-coupling factor ABC transporter ATP-binding protein [Aeromicrobium wangtongii]UUP15469.1 energy-coupling factor ABC transporter ATP-binding protein [Aeromicrobium wangtongii]